MSVQADPLFQRLQQNPGSMGFCTFEEFRKNPAKWRPDPEQLFASVERAASIVNKDMKWIRYEIDFYKCDTLEKVQDVCRQIGYREGDLTAKILIDQLGGGKCGLTVKFFHKDRIKEREYW